MHYYFNVENAIGLIPDEEGRELPDLEAARAEAIKGARSILADDVLKGNLDLRARIDITDGDGKILLSLGFSEAIELLR